MPKVAIVTDSTVNLPRNVISEYSITVVPQIVIWDNKTYLDGIDIQPAEFYTRLTIISIHAIVLSGITNNDARHILRSIGPGF